MKPAKQFDLCPWGKLIAMPHMGWQHAGWFASYVVNATNILEWGCGGSTLWMAMMNTKAHILSVEHDANWLSRVEKAIWNLDRSVECNASVHVVFIPVVATEDIEAYMYASHALTMAPFDLIFVDGHERPACMAAAYDLLAPGGVVFLHDSQRAEYTEAKRLLLEQPDMTLIDERLDESWVNQRAGMWAAQRAESPA